MEDDTIYELSHEPTEKSRLYSCKEKAMETIRSHAERYSGFSDVQLVEKQGRSDGLWWIDVDTPKGEPLTCWSIMERYLDLGAVAFEKVLEE